MTYRGIYRDGVVRLEGDIDLRNGSYVEVNPTLDRRRSKPAGKTARSKPSPKSAGTPWERVMSQSKRMSKAERTAAIMAACGDWKDRPEWKGKSSAQIALELRKQAASRGRNA